jgi:hypothetical protein
MLRNGPSNLQSLRLSSLSELPWLVAVAGLLSHCGDGSRSFREGGGGGGQAGSTNMAKGGAGHGDAGDAGDTGDTGNAGNAGDAGDTGNAGGAGGETTSAGKGGESGGGDDCTEDCDDGSACTTPNQCESGFCVDGVCCNSICDGGCEACSGRLTGAADGRCAGVKTGSDPDDDCESEDASSCGQTGACTSSRECQLYDSDTLCGDPTCSNDTARSARHCDGSGACEAATSMACSPYRCGSDACLESCNGADDCESGLACIEDECREPSDLLGECEQTIDCSEGECIDGLCGLSVRSIRITGSAVSGGGGQIFMDGWFQSDSNGRNLERVSTITQDLRLYSEIDMQSQLTTPLPPDRYLLLTGQEGSNALTRTFQFTLSDGSSVSVPVQVASTDEILMTEGAGDPYTLFHWTGAAVQVLHKTY